MWRTVIASTKWQHFRLRQPGRVVPAAARGKSVKNFLRLLEVYGPSEHLGKLPPPRGSDAVGPVVAATKHPRVDITR
jgi:hypothetical protein